MRRAVPILVSVALLLVAAPAGAHDGAHRPDIVAADAALDSAIGPGVLLVGALAVAGALGMRRRRRLALALAALLLVLAFEAALHSVHHLGDPARAAECAVAVATAHVPIDLAAAVAADPGDVPIWYPIRAPRPDAPAQRAPAARTSRSPPTVLV